MDSGTTGTCDDIFAISGKFTAIPWSPSNDVLETIDEIMVWNFGRRVEIIETEDTVIRVYKDISATVIEFKMSDSRAIGDNYCLYTLENGADNNEKCGV